MKQTYKLSLPLILCCFLALFSQNYQLRAQAQNDVMQAVTCYDSTVFDVFLNDVSISCNRSEIILTISGGSQVGATVFVDANNNIVYKPAPGFMGHDTLEYTVECNSVLYTAQVIVVVVPYPDNIVISDCYGDPAGFGWAIKEEWMSTQSDVLTHSTPCVGDIDGDGIPEIIIARKGSGAREVSGFYIYNGATRASRYMPTVIGHTFGFSSHSIARIKIGSDTIPMLLTVSKTDSKIYAYNLLTGAELWSSNVKVLNDADFHHGNSYDEQTHLTLSFADFDNDGIPEIYVANRIFDAVTGKFLVEGPPGGNKGYAMTLNGESGTESKQYFTVAADVNGDGRLELIAGTEVYAVNINRADPSQNSMTLMSSIPDELMASGFTMKDGITIVADVNQDGQMDVIVCRVNTLTTFGILVWDPRTEELLGKLTYTTNGRNVCSVPFAGIIDNEKDVTIVVVTHNLVSGLKLNQGTKTLTQRYKKGVTDTSGSTGITLFDFNQEGIGKLVYRDEKHLRILKANTITNTFDDLIPESGAGSISAESGTFSEYPVIADVDGDGAAEIVTVGSTGDLHAGTIRIYKSGNLFPWAPARKVWNQYAYNVLNVNEDLTIPQYQMNPATYFPGKSGLYDIQPFNNFLQQQTFINSDGVAFWPLPRVVFETMLHAPPALVVAGDSAVFTGCIKNTGDAALQPPIYVTYYKIDTLPVHKIATTLINHNLMVDSTYCFELVLRNLGSFGQMDSLWISINDRNGVYPYQQQCNLDSRIGFRMIERKVADDHTQVLACQDHTIFDVFPNDAPLIHCNRSEVGIFIADSSQVGATVYVNTDKNIVYTPAAGYIGFDTIKYTLNCHDTIYTAQVFILVKVCPDNISSADCYIDPQGFEWKIAEDWHSAKTDIATYQSPIVGDLDGDGIPEIVVAKFKEAVSGNYRTYQDLYVYKGSDRSTPIVIPTLEGNYMQAGAYAMARVPIGGDTVPLVVVIDNTGRLRAYNPFKTGGVANADDYQWISSTTVVPSYNRALHLGSVAFADFNNDGHPEVYVANRIFDAATGVLLVDGSTIAGANKGESPSLGSSFQYMPAVADIDGDGKLEFVAGTQIYKVNINSGVPNGMTLLTSIPSISVGSFTLKDGITSLVDLNGDGRVDVIFSAVFDATNYAIAAWDIQTQTVLGVTPLGSIRSGYMGIPFIGDVDGDGALEILLTTTHPTLTNKAVIKGYRWVGASLLKEVYSKETDDGSGATGITLFDFNQEGTGKLVYRDEKNLRILTAVPGIGGAVGTFTDLIPVSGAGSISATSGTYYEYPLVVDVDNDGAAEIVVVGGSVASATSGTLRIYKSGNNFNWAPARKVWNQFAYNVVNINEDLTVPRYRANSATIFPGKTGLYDIQPYNNFLQQQTLINQNGVPFYPTPNLVWTTEPVASTAGDSVTFNGCVKNVGSAAFNDVIYFTFYKNDTTTFANIIALDSVKTPLQPDSTTCIKLTINNISAHTPFTSIWISANEKNHLYPYQPQCMVRGRLEVFIKEQMGVNDTVKTNTCHESALFDILLNDTMIHCDRSELTLFITEDSKVGATVSINSNKDIEYTHPLGFTGSDSVEYIVNCNDILYTGKLLILVMDCPDNIDSVKCFGIPPATIWDMAQIAVSDAAVHSLATPFVGDLDHDGHLEVVVPNNDGYPATAASILIFDDQLKLKRTITPPSSMPEYNTMTFLIADVDNDGFGEIVVVCSDLYLRCYSHAGVLKWTSNAMRSGAAAYCPSLIISDIDGDGFSEILAVDKIFAGESGKLLVTLPTGGTGFASGGPESYMPVFADMDNDGTQEVVAGNTVYKIKLTNRTGTAGNSAVILAQSPLPDGFTAVADIDLDGYLDVIVTTGHPTSSYPIVYVWNGTTPDQIGNTILLNGVTSRRISRPFAGDITGDGRPDIAFTYANRIEAYQYDATLNTFIQLWQGITTDGSGATTMSMFDFNQDGEVELVYRDETNLRIIDKNGLDKIALPCGSATHTEYPIVVDLDKDGHADILVSGTVAGYSGVRIVRYGSATPRQWAPARSVWNQHGYNVVHINEDLSVPRHPLNPATVFAGPDGILGTSDDVRPFNAFLQQQTLLSQDGIPYWRMPNIEWTTEPTAKIAGDSVTFEGCITNTGSAPFNDVIYFTFYKNDTLPGNIIDVKSEFTTLLPNGTLCIKFTINDLSSHAPFSSIWVSANDNNGTYPFEPQCMVDGRFEVTLEQIPTPDNYYQIMICPDSVVFDVLLSNTKILCNRSELTLFLSETSKVGATVYVDANYDIIYKPAPNIVGFDTLHYFVSCHDTLFSAYVYITLKACPDNIVDVTCTVPMTPIDFNMKQLVDMPAGDFNSNTGLLVGDLDGDGLPEIVAYYSPVTGTILELRVLDAQTGLPKASKTISDMYASGGWHPTMTAVLVDADRNGMGEIILATSDGNLNSFEADTTGGIFKLVTKWGPVPFISPSDLISTKDKSPQPIVADFNGDGIPEVVVYNQIFNAATGALLGITEDIATAHVGRNPTYNVYNRGTNFQTAADFDGDGLPEIAAGGKVYKVNINAAGTVATCSILYENPAVGDGFTAVADIDMDGKLDVVVTHTVPAYTSSVLYVWRPGLPGSPLMSSVTVASGDAGTYYAHSYPFIGDIDGVVDPTTGKKHPEICVVTSRLVTAYRYVGASGTLTQKWTLGTSDGSGGTGITLFDFNNDGIAELVYRDQSLLRILNGQADGVEPTNLASFSCISGTAWEYPVIADTDGDGSANICVTCRISSTSSSQVRVFGSDGTPWTPTRPVWNQVNYEPLYINDDLTVPTRPAEKHQAYNGKYWYNGALIQVPTLDAYTYDVVIPAAEPQITKLWVELFTIDSAYVCVTVANNGEKNTNAQLPLSIYMNNTYTAPACRVQNLGVILQQGDTVTVKVGVKVSELGNYVAARVQDNGTVFPAVGFSDCDLTNNFDYIVVSDAMNDTVMLLNCLANMPINVLRNDVMLLCSPSEMALSIKEYSKVGATLAISLDKEILYTPKPGYAGLDTFVYAVSCNEIVYTAKVIVNLIACPDNLDTVNCYGKLTSSYAWAIKEIELNKNVLVHNYGPLTVGDIDNDSIVEIVGYIPNTLSTDGYSTTGLRLFYVENEQVKFKKDIPFVGHLSATFGSMALARYNNTGYIVVSGTNGYLYAYNALTGARLWQSSATATTAAGSMINIADFNNDGIPEVWTGNRIFSLATGALICSGTGNNGGLVSGLGSYTTAADITGDGTLELCAGTQIYKVNIPAGATTAGSGTMSVITDMQLAAVPPSAGTDGATTVADIDNDGQLEVVVTTLVSSRVVVYVWKPLPGNASYLVGSYLVPATGVNYYGIPMIGNIDDDPYPEITFITNGSPYYMYALKYNPAGTLGNRIGAKWTLTHTDGSGCTGMSLFDFNIDGVNEIVYRDETTLRIINGNSTTPTPLATFSNVRSGTLRELPIIADVDGDGQAEILIQGWDNVTNINVGGSGIDAGTQNGYLRVYKTGNQYPWASARKVWNQYNYTAVNVNEDLTIPKYQTNIATLFPNGKRPYNGHLMQQTLLDFQGDTYITMPNISWTTNPTATLDGDSMTISGCIENIGSAALQAPIYVTYYIDDTTSTNIMTEDVILKTLLVDSSYCFKLVINDLHTYGDFDSIWVSINDRNGVYPYQVQCMVDGRRPVQILTCPNVEIGTLFVNKQPNCGANNGSLSLHINGTRTYEYCLIEAATSDTIIHYTLYTDPLISGLHAGVYQVLVRDILFRNCEPSKSDMISLKDTSNLLLAVDAISASTCVSKDGILFIQVSGGQAPYSFTLNGDPVTFVSNKIDTLPAGIYEVIVTDVNLCTASGGIVTISSPESDLNVTLIDTTSTICLKNTGTATIEVITALPYYYQLNTAPVQGPFSADLDGDTILFAGLAAGEHQLRVYTSCGEYTSRITINNEDGAVTATVTFRNVEIYCENNVTLGSITINADGGTQPYYYRINNAATWTLFSGDTTVKNLTEGNYLIEVKDDNGCTFKANAIKIIEEIVSIEFGTLHTAKDPDCGVNNGAIEFFITGGSGSYFYSFKADMSAPVACGDSVYVDNLAAGTYTFYVVDVNHTACPPNKSADIVLSNTATDLLVTAVGTNASDCTTPDGTITVQVSGGIAPYTFELYDNLGNDLTAGYTFASGQFVNVPAGNYYVKVIATGGCAASSNMVTVGGSGDDGLSIVMVEKINTMCGKATGVVRIAVTSAFTYTYYLDHLAEVTVPGATAGDTLIFTGLVAGAHTFNLYNACGVKTYDFSITNGTSGLAATAVPQNVQVYCDGSEDGYIAIKITGGTSPYRYSLNGSAWTSLAGAIDTLHNLTVGTYKLEIEDDLGCYFQINDIEITNETSIIALGTLHTAIDPTCGGTDGAIEFFITGGSGSYFYSFHADMSAPVACGDSVHVGGLSAGTYTFYVVDVGHLTCPPTQSADIVLSNTTTDMLVTAITTDASNCTATDGKITVQVSGGTTPFIYELYDNDNNNVTTSYTFASGQFTGVPAGNYYVKVTGGDLCAASSNIVTVGGSGADGLSITILEITNTVCGKATGIVRFAITSTGAYTYYLDHLTEVTTTVATLTFTGLAAGIHSFTIFNDCGTKTIDFEITNGSSGLAATAVPHNVQVYCDGFDDGYIAIQISNGTAPYHYSLNGSGWMPLAGKVDTLWNLPVGTYKLEIEDAAGCSYPIYDIEIIRETNIIALGTLHTAIDPSCGGTDGAIEFFITGGSGSYLYSFHADMSSPVACGDSVHVGGLTAGTYTFYVVDAGHPTCSPTKSADIVLSNTTTDMLVTAVGTDASNCTATDGKISVQVTGGTPSFTFELYDDDNNNVTSSYTFVGGQFINVPAGNYYVKVTGGDLCAASSNMITVGGSGYDGLSIDILEIINTVCGKTTGIVRLNVTSADDYTYYLDHLTAVTVTGATAGTTLVFTGLAAGTHTFTIFNACGTKTVDFEITNGTSGLSAAAVPHNMQVYCDGSTDGYIAIQISNGTSPYRYSLNGSGWMPLAGKVDTLWNLPVGTYKLEIEDAAGCSYPIYDIEIIRETSVIELGTLHVTVEPICSGSNGVIEFFITGGSGSYLYSFLPDMSSPVATDNSVYVSGLTAGPYTFYVVDANHPTCPPVPSAAITLTSAASDMLVTTLATDASACTALDGTIRVQVTGGTAPFTFELYDKYSNNVTSSYPFAGGQFTGVPAGSYTVKVTDGNGCVAGSSTVKVGSSSDDGLSITLLEIINTRCGVNTGIAVFLIKSPDIFTFYLDHNSEISFISEITIPFLGLPAGIHTLTVYNDCGTRTVEFEITNLPGELSAKAVAKNVIVSCDGLENGYIAINITNGTAPYYYSLNGSAWAPLAGAIDTLHNLAVGTYKLEIRDFLNCAYQINDIKISRETFTLELGTLHAATHPTCGVNNGSILLYVEGGSGAYEYRLNNGAFKPYTSSLIGGLPAGSYKVEVRDQNHHCATVMSNEVILKNTNSNMTLLVNTTDASSCTATDGSLSVIVSGGAPPYTLKMNGVTMSNTVMTGLHAGVYVIEAKDANGCVVSSGEVRIGAADAHFTMTVLENIGTACGENLGAVRIEVQGEMPYYYQLDGMPVQNALASTETIVLTNLSAGTHQLHVFGACGEEFFSFNVDNCTGGTTTPADLAVTATVLKNVVEINGTVTYGEIDLGITGGNPSYTYSIDGGATWKPSGAHTIINNLEEGWYKIEVKDASGCTYAVNMVHIIRIISNPKLADCDAMIDRVADEDYYQACHYTHSGSEWDQVLLVYGTLDSLQYFINDILVSHGAAATLSNSIFPVGVSTVTVISYFGAIIDTCEFTVTIERVCPPTATDIETHEYSVTKLAKLCWTSNLRTTKYSNDVDIQFAKTYTCAGCPEQLDTIFGLLYTWYSAVGVEEGSSVAPTINAKGFVQGICPNGWHIPSQAELSLMTLYPANDLKSTDYWIVPGSNLTGFDSRPAGKYNGAINRFEELYGFTAYWSCDADPSVSATGFTFTYYCSKPQEDPILKTDGISVRCIWDGEDCP